MAWAVREGQPWGAGDASLLAGTLPNPKVKDLQEANAALRMLIANDVPIWIKPIPLDRLKLLVFADSGFDNAGGGQPSSDSWSALATRIFCRVTK